MQIEQFIMAYEAEQDRLRALLPEGFVSLRPGLRINAEIRNGNQGYVEFNTPVERDGVRGWLNIGFWKGVPFAKQGSTTVFRTDFLKMQFTGTGIEGGCPAERITPAAFFWETPFGCKRPRSFSIEKSFAIVALPGNIRKRMLMGQVSHTLLKSSMYMKRRLLHRKMPPGSPAGRFWAPTGCCLMRKHSGARYGG